ncbi:MAG: hypoxanthine phosphoribosyltransferase [Clostridia bacterium]|nr:hypoxanthine phosphoribosyltransferase [Clostridia bacterium]
MKYDLVNDVERVLFSEEEIEQRVSELGKEISEYYKDKNLLLVSVLKGSIVFMADLMRHITVPCSIDFMAVSSYKDGTVSTGNVQIRKDLDIDLKGYDLLIVEDIFDSGRTLQHLTDVLELRHPNSIRLCTLLDKPDRRDPNVKIKADYIGMQVPDLFVIGYGLDYAQKYRNLPYIGIIKPEIPAMLEEEKKRSENKA